MKAGRHEAESGERTEEIRETLRYGDGGSTEYRLRKIAVYR
ncbi:hypothetical protein [Saccharibacillus alkalitolerans]|nr:hypothetical protein [Saccharibacillus alkalitolerans]